jgi:hypothetical protein
MRRLGLAFVVVCAVFASIDASSPAEARCHGLEPPDVPPELAVPDVAAPTRLAPAQGVQIYTCGVDAAGAYAWSFVAPEATLFDAHGRRVGSHFAGPTWQLRDGSKVVGRVLSKAAAPEAGAVPWLLLEIVDNSGRGELRHARYIQRVHTAGGNAPAGGCDAEHVGDEARVDYTADYYFW